MGLWEAMTGRMRRPPSNLDAFFQVPGAAITLETAAGILPTGTGAVCFRSASGAAFAQTQAELLELLRTDPKAPTVEVSQDRFGFTWLVVRRDASDLTGVCTDLHVVNTLLEEQGFGGGVLCSLIGFTGSGEAPVGLVYLYKQGTFYPFAPVPGGAGAEERRDNLLELQVRDLLAEELPLEPDMSRWMAVWGAPGLR